jgi:hypothetical protein
MSCHEQPKTIRGSISSVERRTLHRLASVIDSPRSLAVSLLFGAGEIAQLQDLEPILNCPFSEPQHVAEDLLITEVAKKSPKLITGIDTKAVALESFLAAEERCSQTNVLFAGPESQHPSWVFEMKSHIRRILGNLDPNAFLRHCRFGPGATTSVGSSGSIPPDKFDGEVHLTEPLIPFVKQIMGETWHAYHPGNWVVSRGSRLAFVPKNAKTDRSITIGNSLNVFGQLGIGKLLRSRLKSGFGIDLDDQRPNQKAAQRAFSDGLCTIDLSSASDMISEQLIRYLLPPDWLHLLELFRESCVQLPDGSWLRLDKWSSMGNGYTFELETLVFLSVCMAVVPHEDWDTILVYGDDIIVTQSSASSLVEALEYLGFKVNAKKSHLAGEYFESCGKHYFRGKEVTPFFFRGEKQTVPYSVHIANRLRVWAALRDPLGHANVKYKPVWDSLHKAAPAKWKKLIVPESLGDCGFFGPFSEASIYEGDPLVDHKGSLRWDPSWENVPIRTCAMTTVKRRCRSFGLYLFKLNGLERAYAPWWTGQHDSGDSNLVPARGLYGVIRARWTVVNPWSDELAWSS